MGWLNYLPILSWCQDTSNRFGDICINERRIGHLYIYTEIFVHYPIHVIFSGTLIVSKKGQLNYNMNAKINTQGKDRYDNININLKRHISFLFLTEAMVIVAWFLMTKCMDLNDVITVKLSMPICFWIQKLETDNFLSELSLSMH